jgi:hypothetical protein
VATALSIGGTASDNVDVQVTWVNDRGGSGTASGTTSWSVPAILREERPLKGSRQRPREEERDERAGQAREPGRERAAETAEHQDAPPPEAITQEADGSCMSA